VERVMDESKHYPWLDWLRFLAALNVLAVHARGTFIVEFGGLPSDQKTTLVALTFVLTRRGNEAVIVFFVLSGYLVGGKAISQMCTQEFKLVDYSINRFSRIYLPYIPALFLSWACAASVGLHPSAVTFFCNVFSFQGIFGENFFGGNVPLWSLAYEVWFYTLAGSLGAFLRIKDRGLLKTILAAAGLLLSLAIFTILPSTYLFCWLIGGMAYFYCQSDRRILCIALLMAIFSIAGIQIRLDGISVDTAAWGSWFPSLPIMQLLFATSVAALITQLVHYRPASSFSRRIDRAGTALACFSYTLYLTHYPVLRVTEFWMFPKRSDVSLASTGSVLAGCCISTITALIMYVLFERNTVRFKRWLQRLTTGAAAQKVREATARNAPTTTTDTTRTSAHENRTVE
jgi:peptidoglycan/LPS O-acetylase OafA/YrhL